MTTARVILLVGDLGRLQDWLPSAVRPDIVWLRADAELEALELVDAVTPKPDLALVSLVLERGNGHDACAALRARLGAAIPIVLVSSRCREVDRQYAAMVGASGFLAASERDQFLTDLEAFFPDWT